MYCVSSRSETILQLVKDKTILLLSPCMAYSGESNGGRINIVSVLASSWAWSYSVNSLFSRPGAIVLQRSVWDVYRSDFRVWRGSQRLDWDLWDRGRHWRNRGWVGVPRSECVRVIWSSLEVTEFTTMFFQAEACSDSCVRTVASDGPPWCSWAWSSILSPSTWSSSTSRMTPPSSLTPTPWRIHI